LLLQVSPDAEAFEGLDDEFYRYPDDLASLVMRYNSGRETQS
jgi:hypothetical protein